MISHHHCRIVLCLSPWLACALPAAAQVPGGRIDGCVLRLDAMDIDGDGADDQRQAGSRVAAWRDQAAAHQHALQSDETQQPVYVHPAVTGYPSLRFEGGQCLATNLRLDWSVSDWTAVAVATLDAGAQDGYRGIMGNRFGAGRGTWWTLGTKADGTAYLELAAGKGVHTRRRLGDSKPHLYTIVKRGSRFELFQDGTSLGSAEMANVGDDSNEFRLGRWYSATQGWHGRIAEIRIYDRALVDEQRRLLEARLTAKWELVPPPGLYRRRSEWADTMTAAREALIALDSNARVPVRRDWRAYVLDRVRADFPSAALAFEQAGQTAALLDWFQARRSSELEQRLVGDIGKDIRRRLRELRAAGVPAGDARWLRLIVAAARLRARFEATAASVAAVDLPALRRAVAQLTRSFPDGYISGRERLLRIDGMDGERRELLDSLGRHDEDALGRAEDFLAFRRASLLANPLLDFDRVLFVRRALSGPRLGLPQNWQSNCVLPRRGYRDEIASFRLADAHGESALIYRPEAPVFVGDVDLHFDAERMLFSSIGRQNRWQIFEIGVDGTGLRQVTPGDEPDVDHYDACYLPDGDIVFCSNAYYAAVPCVNGSARTAVLYRMRPDGTGIRQLCFDQEHNWCPTVLNNGRVMYLRWEYTDTPHSHDRVLFHMNPDGTGQMEYYGSNSYWPNSLFYARPIPHHPTAFVGIVGGHHGVPRMGELVLFDPARGRREAAGALQRIPGYGKAVASETDPKYGSTLIQDRLVDGSWPKFLHPYPLSDTFFLVSCKPSPDALWGIYLVDVYDNMLLLREEPEHALFEPIPLRRQAPPPVIPSKVNLERDDALVYMVDVYAGDGLSGIPRGTVRSLRLFSYHYLYPGMGGPQAVVGMEGPWDIKRVMGTVPVDEDGSAFFRVPANTPIAVQPLDDEGRALQLMRSWFTAMPGEVLSCVGCHESQNRTPPARMTQKARSAPDEIEPWHGPTRGFNFIREVQPVLDRYCIGCHGASERPPPVAARAWPGVSMPDLETREHITDYRSVFHSGRQDAGHFSVSYAELHRFVRRPGLESDYHLLTPLEFHANTTQLVQMLEKGHHGVQLDSEAWDRLITWIDLNAPYHGTWHEIAGIDRTAHPARRRRELLRRYANVDQDFEYIPEVRYRPGETVLPPSPPATLAVPAVFSAGWPFDAAEAQRRQERALALLPAVGDTAGSTGRYTVDLGDGLTLELVLIPAGRFVMGSTAGYSDESPPSVVVIEEPFWMGRTEITNAQYERFDPGHDSKVEHRFSMQFGVRGFYVNGPKQPVVRVSWEEASAFCAWLSRKTGRAFSLPSEAQWEYACRAGSADAFFFGALEADYSAYANLADQTLREFVCHTYKKERVPWLHAGKYDDWIPKDLRFNDDGFLADGVGQYSANPWGLHDMHGNVWEWTRSVYRPYPYDADDGRNAVGAAGDRVVRGGSWRDRPSRARSAMRLPYRPYQRVYNVGFRVVCAVGAGAAQAGGGPSPGRTLSASESTGREHGIAK